MGSSFSAAESPTTGIMPRRTWMSRCSSAVMVCGLSLGYGMFGTVIGFFLYPAKASSRTWQFLVDLGSFAIGESVTYEAPAGQKIVVTRLADKGIPEDFIALSSICPHLGCQVHWESNNDRFFCPCHNGAFDKSGQPTSGPPKDSNKALPRYPLKVDRGMLFIEVPTEALV
ncbi:MAG: succinate dehydrogenase and fumarate reductase iron-sulfur protein [Planctomycetota bacterium]|nr:MAG: succinate dehydrogenase and fumarate reductase iron-sulfur protein [Planctomycetota bacterium]